MMRTNVGFGANLSVESAVTEVQRGVNGLVGFKVDVDLLFLSFLSNYCTTINDLLVTKKL